MVVAKRVFLYFGRLLENFEGPLQSLKTPVKHCLTCVHNLEGTKVALVIKHRPNL